MEKSKNKTKRGANSYEFLSPFRFEECVNRLPSDLVHYIDDDTVEFKVKHLDLKGRLQRWDDDSTLVTGHKRYYSPLLMIIIALLGIISLILGQTSPYPQIGMAGVGLIILSVFLTFELKDQHKPAHQALAIFQPIPKLKPDEKPRKPFLPGLSFTYTAPHKLNICAVRLQRLGLQPHKVGLEIQYGSGLNCRQWMSPPVCFIFVRLTLTLPSTNPPQFQRYSEQLKPLLPNLSEFPAKHTFLYGILLWPICRYGSCGV